MVRHNSDGAIDFEINIPSALNITSKRDLSLINPFHIHIRASKSTIMAYELIYNPLLATLPSPQARPTLHHSATASYLRILFLRKSSAGSGLREVRRAKLKAPLIRIQHQTFTFHTHSCTKIIDDVLFI